MKSQCIDNSNWRKLETVSSKFKSWNSMVAEDGSFYGILLLLVVFSIQVSFKVNFKRQQRSNYGSQFRAQNNFWTVA